MTGTADMRSQIWTHGLKSSRVNAASGSLDMHEKLFEVTLEENGAGCYEIQSNNVTPEWGQKVGDQFEK
jgi:hypothetical protein